MKRDYQKTFIEIPVGYEEYEAGVVIFNTSETDEMVGRVGIVCQADSLEEAKKKFARTLKYHLRWTEERSNELDKWKPFSKGDWKYVGGTWFTVYGLNIYFRRGKNMKGGWYIPFTNLNISITNHWKKRLPPTVH